MRAIFVLAAFAILVGCSHTSPITVLNGDLLSVTHRGATGASSASGVREIAMSQARQFCVSQGKTFTLVELVEHQPPYILGNFPQTEVRFRCS